MAFEIQISTGSTVPIFKQIVDQVRLATARGALAPGHQLPSVRALAERLVVNPNTVARAYADLSRDGIIETQQGKGVFVAAQRQVYTKAERLRRIEPALEAFVNAAVALNFTSDEMQQALQKKLSQLQLINPQKGGRNDE